VPKQLSDLSTDMGFYMHAQDYFCYFELFLFVNAAESAWQCHRPTSQRPKYEAAHQKKAQEERL